MTDFDSLDQLPIHQRQADILTSVDTSQVTIITAETGAGKSTQVPQYLAQHGYQKVIVTQPRILAARNLSQRVRQEYSYRLGSDATALVGYRTAMERDDDPQNVILYCTDGLQLVRELTGSGITERQVLVLDEIHEWNENMEVLVAWAKQRCQEDPRFKVVLMSATIEADELAAYFGSGTPITVAGRSYDVQKRQGSDLVTEIVELLADRVCNMLVFLPGKAEIENVAEAIQSLSGTSVPIIPLHSQLDPETQQRAFARYPGGKVILATNVAQTSITIDDIDVVVDSGLERRAEVRSGVEGLFIEQVSQADCLQRAGRAGRTKAGLYVLAPLDRLPCAPLEARPAYGVPEIMRKHIDRLALRLAAIGLDVEALDFYHAPSKKTIKLAKRTLVSLGALDTAGRVTSTGRAMEHLPVESSYARMLVEAAPLGPSTQAKLAAIIAIQEVGGIVKGGPRYTGWRRYTQQTRSDLLAQYDVYLVADTIDPLTYDELGIIGKNLTKAQEVTERLHRSLSIPDSPLTSVDNSELDALLQCIVAGQLHQLWILQPDGKLEHLATKKQRELSTGTVVRHATILAGTPFDLEIATARGMETLHIVNELTAVDPLWLERLAPSLFAVQPGKPYYDSRSGTLATRMFVRYNGRRFEANGIPLMDHSPQAEQQFVRLYAEWLHQVVDKERHMLQLLNFRRIPHITVRQVEERVRHYASGVISLAELPKKQRIELGKLAHLEPYLGREYMDQLITSPEGGRHGHGPAEHHRRHHGWRHSSPRHGRREW